MSSQTKFKLRPLGDLCEVTGGNSAPQGEDHFRGGKIPFVRMRDLGGYHHTTCLDTTRDAVTPATVEKMRLKIFEPGCILFPRSGSVQLNHRAILAIRACIVSHIGILKQFSEDIEVRYLYWFLVRYDMSVIAKQTTGLDLVGFSDVKKISVPVPSLPEQHRIVAEIEKQFTRLEAGVSALKRIQANLKRYRAAVLNAACEGRLVPTESAWPQKQIATAIRTMDQGWSPRCESEPSDNDATWAVIKTTAIQNLRFVEVENKKLPLALKPRLHLELQSGDLLVTRAGPRNRVGVACLVKSTRPRLILCDKVYRLRCKPEVASPAFLELVLNAPHIVDEVNKLKTGISDSGVNLTQKRFGELLIPFPPLAEQTRIVAEVERRLSVVEELEATVSANLQRAARLRQAVLQKAFSGELC